MPPDVGGSIAAGASPSAEAILEGARWTRLQSVVDAALDAAPADRAPSLEAACGSDAALHTAAARLVEACERADGAGLIFDSPALAFAAPMLAEVAREEATQARERDLRLLAALRAALAERYAVERELGRGGMATVFLARDLRHDRLVAVKVLDRGFAPSAARRFLREIRTAARLTHPHVLGLHDSGESEGLLYYVMPFVEGETLRQRLVREGALAVPDVVRLVRELADALAYAHGRGVLHRDLKPENVLLSGGHAVVADFGIATAFAAASAGAQSELAAATQERVIGTPAYMAPEQAVADPAADQRADLYSLGVIAYETLTGAHPFAGRSRSALLAAHLSERPAPVAERRADTPPELAKLVMQLLDKDPADRPPDAQALVRALDALPAARSDAPLVRGWSRRVAAGLAAVAVLSAAAAGYAIWRRGDGVRAPAPVAARSGGGISGTVIRAVAVLPFRNAADPGSGDYFAEGITDELSHALTRLPGLRVTGRTSSYAFKGRNLPASEIGRVLGVGALIDGTVRRSGDRLRVSAQLVSTADGKVLWDSVFESPSSEMFALQDRFTRAIVGALEPALADGHPGETGPLLSRGAPDAEAYDLYLRGRYHFLQRGSANLRMAIGLFKRALARDPAFARAHAGLAMAYAMLPVFEPDPADSATALTEVSARRALALDSTLADAQLALGASLDMRLRFREALARYRAAVALDPASVTAHHWLGFSLLNLGRTDDAIAELRHASQLDPLAASPASAASTALLYARRFPEAAAAAKHVLALDSTYAFGLWTLGMAQAFGGQQDSAVRTLQRGVRFHPDDSRMAAALLFAYAAAGRWADAELVRRQLRQRGADLFDGTAEPFAALVFGDPAPLVQAFASETGRRRYIASGGAFGCNPLMDPLWADPRFRATMGALTVERCRLARPWRLPPRPRA